MWSLFDSSIRQRLDERYNYFHIAYLTELVSPKQIKPIKNKRKEVKYISNIKKDRQKDNIKYIAHRVFPVVSFLRERGKYSFLTCLRMFLQFNFE